MVVTNDEVLEMALGRRLKQFIADICGTVGPRLGTSVAEHKAGQRLFAEYARYCDSTFTEEFTCHPAAFLDSIRVSVALYLVGVCLYLVWGLATAFLGVLAFLIFVVEVMYLKEVVDPFFPQRRGANIYGKIRPTEIPKRVVLISGHHDSAYEFPLFEKIGRHARLFIVMILGLGILTILLGVFRGLATYLFPPMLALLNWLVIVPLVSVIPMLMLAFRLRSGKVVLGANDNLSGVAVTLGVGEWLAQHRLRHTEVWLVSFACEENMRGSKRFALRHREELRDAVLLNFDSVGAGALHIVTAEPMFRTTLTTSLCMKVAMAAQVVGLPLPTIKLPLGGTDASNFIRAGLQATSIIGISTENVPLYWHTVEDTPDKLDPQVLLDAVKLAIAFLQQVDQE